MARIVEKKNDGKTGNSRLVVAVLFFAVAVFLCLGLTWLLSIWHDITFDEIVFYLSAPLDGTSQDVMNSFYLRVVFLSVIAVIVFAALLIIFRIRKNG